MLGDIPGSFPFRRDHKGRMSGGVRVSVHVPISVPQGQAAPVHPAPAAPRRQGALASVTTLAAFLAGCTIFGIATGLAISGESGAFAIVGVLLLALAVQFSLVIDRRRERARWHRREGELLRLAGTDPLTGLDNRLGFETALARLNGEGAPIMVALADLDRFKAVNDAHGHLAGDAVLIEVAARLRHHAPSACSIARLGGDEFALVFAAHEGADRAETELAEARAAIACPYDYADVLLTVETSLGFCGSKEVGSETTALLRCADARLYADKMARRAFARASRTSAFAQFASVA